MARLRRFYLDATAFSKLFLHEPESESVRRVVADATATSSVLLRIEGARLARRAGGEMPAQAAKAITRVDLDPLDREVRDMASEIGPANLRTLDAIHLATAERARESIDAFLTYDRHLAEAAQALGIEVLSPA